MALSTTTAPATLDGTVRVEMVQTKDVVKLLSRDRTFDLFDWSQDSRKPQDSQNRVDSELPAIRPGIATKDRLIWGFAYQPLYSDPDYPKETPIIRVAEDLGFFELLKIALKAEMRTGKLRWREIDSVVDLCTRHVPDRDVPADVLSMIDVERDVRPSLWVFRRLSEELRTAVDAGEIDLRTAESVPPGMVPIIGELFLLVNSASFSERRQIVRMTADIVRMRDGDNSIIAELKGRDSAEVLEVLRRILRPETNRIEEEVSHFRRRYTRGTGVNVTLPKNLEGDYIEVCFRARSEEEFLRRLDTLETMKEKVDDLVGLLF